MALTIDVAKNDVLSMEDFVQYVERNIDVDDVDALCGCAPAFKALLNNRDLLAGLIVRELRSWRDFQQGNSYVGTTLMLARSRRFLIRANIWLPEKPGLRARGDSRIYGLTHDHNFTFMTGGYYGSGYTTEIYELASNARGVPGERVDLEFLERTTLPSGKIMLYRALDDVHRQSRPEDFSISINLVVPTHTKTRPQYFFDLERSVITRSDYPEHGRSLALFRLAAYAGDARTCELLGDIALGNANPHVRAGAFEALCECEPAAAAELAERVGSDPHPRVRAAAEHAVAKRPSPGDQQTQSAG